MKEIFFFTIYRHRNINTAHWHCCVLGASYKKYIKAMLYVLYCKCHIQCKDGDSINMGRGEILYCKLHIRYKSREPTNKLNLEVMV